MIGVAMRSRVRTSLGLRRAVALFTPLVAVVLAAAPAGARPSTSQVGTAGRHCVAVLAKGVNTNPDTTCFGTFTEAIRHATGGAVADAPADPASALKDARFVAKLNEVGRRTGTVSPQAGMILSLEYTAPNYGGAWSLTLRGPVACTGSINDIDYQMTFPPPPLGAPIWSFRAMFNPSYCFADHFMLPNFVVPHTGYRPSGNLPWGAYSVRLS
jgi:hypothetical protein